MELSTTVLAAQTLQATLGSSQLNKIISSIGPTATHQYLKIRITLSDIIPLLRDAEFRKYDLSHEAQTWLNKFKDIVFEARDLLDELVTLAKRDQLLKPEKGWPRFSLATNTRVGNKAFSQVLEKINKRLDALKHTMFDITPYDHTQIKQRRIDSDSYVKATDIIGRDDDLNNIVGMLLDPNVQHDQLSFLTIVGIGGMGKTTLAQLVYNDTRITNAFPLMLWTCISDRNQEELYGKEIFGKILGQNLDNCTMEWVYKQISQKLSSTRYLLVLDDVWTEDRENWLTFAGFLNRGQRGSWVVVTTRSEITARVVGNGVTYKLQGLSEESSWQLFERMAFELDLSNSPPVDRVKIGRQIVDRCAQVPLAIREMGRLLGGLDTSEWLSFGVNLKEFISTWKLSYDDLKSPLKSCFQYCALFPKGFEFEKEMLISLWMAQGYLIIPDGENKSIEDIGEEYISIFLDKYIFQDIKKNKLGDIVSFKMHNLMHDVAVSVADEEIYATSTFTGNDNLDRKICHLSVTREGHSDYSFANTRIYSYLHVGYNGLKKEKANKTFFESVIANCRYLKTLHLSGLMIHSLPESLGDLIHIRYLNLSDNIDLHLLPVSITKLHNLQTLYLRRCSSLIELPKDLGRLVNLRTLDISSCNKIRSMPRGMDKMTCLCKLSDFVVDVKADYSSLSKYFEGFKELKPLNNLKGCLNIHIKWRKDVMKVVKEDRNRKGSYLKSKEHINTLNFDFQHDLGDERIKNENVRTVMEELEPHSNLKVLEVKNYHGSRMPSWIAFLSNLVELHLVNCGELEYLPCLGNLIHLKVLKLMMLAELEYIGEDDQTADSSSTPDLELVSAERSSYLPCLETLELSNLPKLKAWRPKGKGDDHLLEESCRNKKIGPCFSELKLLFLWDCPELTCIPFCPSVEELKLINFNERLRIMDNTGNFEELRDVDSASTSAPCRQHGTTRIKKVAISNVGWLGLLPMQAFRFLEKMEIWCDKEVQSLTEVEQVFCSCSSSLRILTVHNCRNIRSVVSGGLKHLTALKELHIRNCDNLSLSEEIEEVKESKDGIGIGIGMARQFSYHSLQILTLQGLLQLENLPDWIQFFPNLQSIGISFCSRLKSLPDWMSKLTSLRQLSISSCSRRLERRCKDPDGEDWPCIQHIPKIQFRNCLY